MDSFACALTTRARLPPFLGETLLIRCHTRAMTARDSLRTPVRGGSLASLAARGARRMLLGAAVLLAGTSVAHATTRANATASASASIIARLCVIKTQELDIGSFRKPNCNSTIVVGPDGTVTYTGVKKGVGECAKPGCFKVTGEPGFTYSVTLPHTFTLNRLDDGEEADDDDVAIIVEHFTLSPCGTIGADGTATFCVGATFDITSKQASGDYDCSISVAVSYD